MVATVVASSILSELGSFAKKMSEPLVMIGLNLPGVLWMIFALIAIQRAFSYTGETFWKSIPSADPRFSHSIDDFTDAKKFNPQPTYSKF